MTHPNGQPDWTVHIWSFDSMDQKIHIPDKNWNTFKFLTILQIAQSLNTLMKPFFVGGENVFAMTRYNIKRKCLFVDSLSTDPEIICR